MALLGAGAVCVVCRGDRAAVEQAMSVAPTIHQQHGCVVCVVDVDGAGPRAAHLAASWGMLPVEYVPVMKRPAAPLAPFQVRQTMVRLAAALMGMAAGDESIDGAVGGRL